VHNVLSQSGFRRSQSIAYRPACLRCNACRSVRVPVRDFELSRNDRKVLARNESLVRRPVVSQATREQFRLLKSYVKTRHDNGGMSEMTYRDYVAMVGGSPVQSLIFEYRDGPEDNAPLVAASIMVTTGPVNADANEAPVGNIPAAVITAGNTHTCAILDGGDVTCWGRGTNGQLGYGNPNTVGDVLGEIGAAVDLGDGRTATSLAAGTAHTCAILDTGGVKCWGSGGSGRLGNGDTANIGEQLGTQNAAATSQDMSTGEVVLKAWPFSSKLMKFSNQFLSPPDFLLLIGALCQSILKMPQQFFPHLKPYFSPIPHLADNKIHIIDSNFRQLRL
jgi:hypothetical protein